MSEENVVMVIRLDFFPGWPSNVLQIRVLQISHKTVEYLLTQPNMLMGDTLRVTSANDWSLTRPWNPYDSRRLYAEPCRAITTCKAAFGRAWYASVELELIKIS